MADTMTKEAPGHCPRCGSDHVTVTLQVPPRHCLDCGDIWAGMYQPEDHLVMWPQSAKVKATAPFHGSVTVTCPDPAALAERLGGRAPFVPPS